MLGSTPVLLGVLALYNVHYMNVLASAYVSIISNAPSVKTVVAPAYASTGVNDPGAKNVEAIQVAAKRGSARLRVKTESDAVHTVITY